MPDGKDTKTTAPRRASVALRMPAPSIGVESYMHRAAKEVLAGWLREAAAEVGWDAYTRLGPICWRVNRDGPAWGVHIEYPLPEKDPEEVWDERADGFDHAPPTAEWCFSRGIKVAAVADVVVQHKGRIAYAVEVVHRHPCPMHKRAFYHHHDIDLVEVKADWVLKQVARPRALMGRCSRPFYAALPGHRYHLMGAEGFAR